jgi:hypothetical protein
MRRLGVVILGLSLAILGLARPVAAAAQFTIWPANYSYGTPPPAGQFTWSATTYAITFEQSLAPFTSLRTNLAYGPTNTVNLNGSALSGFSGGVLLADAALRVGMQTGPVGLTAYGGYGGLFFNATGSTASDRVVLQSSGTRIGVEANMSPAPGVSFRGSYTVTTGLTTNANISITSPLVTGAFSGSGTGNEYELALVLSPVPMTSMYAGYRSGTQQITWSGGGGNTTNTWSGWMVGVDLRF